MSDATLQVAPDSTGKSVDMTLLQTGSGSAIYRERAEMVGDSADILFQTLAVNKNILACLRALLANWNAGSTTPFGEDDFLNID